jgi:hypothetical protein
MSELLTKTSSFDYSDVPSGSSSFDYSDVPSWEEMTSEVQLGTPTIQLTKDEAGEETYVPRVSDPDSWSSNALRSMNQLEQGMARTVELLGKKFEIPELEVLGNRGTRKTTKGYRLLRYTYKNCFLYSRTRGD